MPAQSAINSSSSANFDQWTSAASSTLTLPTFPLHTFFSAAFLFPSSSFFTRPNAIHTPNPTSTIPAAIATMSNANANGRAASASATLANPLVCANAHPIHKPPAKTHVASGTIGCGSHARARSRRLGPGMASPSALDSFSRWSFMCSPAAPVSNLGPASISHFIHLHSAQPTREKRSTAKVRHSPQIILSTNVRVDPQSLSLRTLAQRIKRCARATAVDRLRRHRDSRFKRRCNVCDQQRRRGV